MPMKFVDTEVVGLFVLDEDRIATSRRRSEYLDDMFRRALRVGVVLAVWHIQMIFTDIGGRPAVAGFVTQ